MFGRKKGEVKEGDYIFTSRKDDGDYHNIVFGTVTGVDAVSYTHLTLPTKA